MAPYYMVLRKQPGTLEYTVVAAGMGRRKYYYSKYQKCLASGYSAKMVTFTGNMNKRVSCFESGQSQTGE